MGLAEYQEGREKGGAHCLDMEKSVRRATRAISLALAGSYHKLVLRFLRLVASCIKGEVA